MVIQARVAKMTSPAQELACARVIKNITSHPTSRNGLPRFNNTTALPISISNFIFKMKAYVAVPVTLAMVFRAYSHKSLTPAGIVAAVLTAAAHAVHPWSLPFALLIVFFMAGTRVTKVRIAPDMCELLLIGEG